MYEKELELAQKLAVAAGAEIMKIYNTDFEVAYKKDESPLTEADLNANRVIENELTTMFPDYGFLSEESSQDLSRREKEFCWIIDPLDGTKEFIKRNDEFTVNIALSRNGRPVLGVVYVPVTEELYYAVKGKGAYYSKDGKTERINVSGRTENIVLLSSRSHRKASFEKILENNKEIIDRVIAAGSSLKGCLVARGVADVYYRYGPTGEWDTAAMEMVVLEAGGIFKDMNDEDIVYNRMNNINEIGFYILNSLDNKLVNSL